MQNHVSNSLLTGEVYRSDRALVKALLITQFFDCLSDNRQISHLIRYDEFQWSVSRVHHLSLYCMPNKVISSKGSAAHVKRSSSFLTVSIIPPDWSSPALASKSNNRSFPKSSPCLSTASS